MNLAEPSTQARALARSYISRTIKKMQGRAGPRELGVTSPTHEEARAKVDSFSSTFDNYTPSADHEPKPGYATAPAPVGASVVPPLQDGPKSDSVSHYLQSKLEADQGVGERYESTREMSEMEARLEVEEKRLAALRETRKQVDKRAAQTARATRQVDREFNHRYHLPQRPVKRDAATRSARSSALAASLERERGLLAKARQHAAVAASSSTATSTALAGTYTNYVENREGRYTAASGQRSEIARMLDEQRTLLASDRAKLTN